jgi:peptidoglycan hydrolase-like protein with peptidoglycan-binding domain
MEAPDDLASYARNFEEDRPREEQFKTIFKRVIGKFETNFIDSKWNPRRPTPQVNGILTTAPRYFPDHRQKSAQSAMSPSAVRFAFLTFALLTGAMTANIFVFQPPARQLAAVGSARDAVPGWSGALAPAREGGGAKPGAVVLPIETGTVKPLPEAADRSDLVRAIQRELKAKGYETGAVDGVPGLVTRGAIMAYESDAGLPLTGAPSQDLLQHLVLGSAEGPTYGAGNRTSPGPEAEAVIRAVQRAFRQLGYMTTMPDGRLNDSTRRAIRKFELDRKLKETGRISGELVAKLASLASDALQSATP